MKGVVSTFELLITGIILVLAFIHFFPQYSIKTNWSSVILGISVMDTLNSIDRLGNVYNYATNDVNFENFMDNSYSPLYTDHSFVWWKEVRVSNPGLPGAQSTVNRPYFTEAKKETMVDVVEIGETFYVYSFSIGLGYPY